MSQLLPSAAHPQAAYLRSPPRLLCRGITLPSSSSRLWLFRRLLPGPLPSLPPGHQSLLLCFPSHGPRSQPKKSAARELIIRLRKQNLSIYEISQALKEQNHPLSPTAVGEVLKEEGFAPLPRRRDEDRPNYPRPSIEAVADLAHFSLAPRQFTTACGGLFLFVPDMVRLALDQLAPQAHLPGSKMIPATHALRTCLALKLWSIERKSHAMALSADEGLALFSGLNAFPKKSYLSEYSSRVHHAQTTQLLAAWHD